MILQRIISLDITKKSVINVSIKGTNNATGKYLTIFFG